MCGPSVILFRTKRTQHDTFPSHDIVLALDDVFSSKGERMKLYVQLPSGKSAGNITEDVQ